MFLSNTNDYVRNKSNLPIENLSVPWPPEEDLSNTQFKNPCHDDYHILLVIVFVQVSLFDKNHSNALLVSFTAFHIKK